MFERQNVIAAAAVLVGFVVAAWVRPDPAPSFRVELARVAAAEREILNRYQSAAARFKAGEIDDARFAMIIEQGVLGPYAGIRREIDGLHSHPDAEPEFLAQVSRFADVRVESWRLLVKALREQDQEKLQQHKRKWAEADAAANRLLLRRSGPSLEDSHDGARPRRDAPR